MLGALCKGRPPSPTHCLPSLCCYALLTGGCVRPGHHPERVLHAAAALARLLTLLPNHPQGGAAGQGRAGGVPWRGRGAKCKVQALAPWRHVRLLAPFMGGCLSIVCSAPNDSAPLHSIAGGHQRRAAMGGPRLPRAAAPPHHQVLAPGPTREWEEDCQGKCCQGDRGADPQSPSPAGGSGG